MLFGLCNAPATFHRCMVSIFSDYVENIIDVFMDDFTVYCDSFDACLTNLIKVLRRCIETKLVLNYEKCHFMVDHSIILGHIVSFKVLKLIRLKYKLLNLCLTPRLCRRLVLFLDMQDSIGVLPRMFPRLLNPCVNYCKKYAIFEFDEACKGAFNTLKDMLTSAPVIQPPNWSLPFEIMYDASNHAIGAILG